MSLKNLLPDGTYDEIVKEAGLDDNKSDSKGPLILCPHCKKPTVYDTRNPFRPFCSERCKLIDLGAWASDEIVIKGRKALEDEDSDLLMDPNLPRLYDEK